MPQRPLIQAASPAVRPPNQPHNLSRSGAVATREDIERIREIATHFRQAIERCDLPRLGPTFEEFPAGSCGDATPLLGTYLCEQGFGQFGYMLGERPIPNDWQTQSHAWLQQGELIVDITADQFPEVSEPVIVTAESAWHSQFEGTLQHAADYRVYGGHATPMLHHAYIQIMERLQDVPTSRGYPNGKKS